MHPITALKNRVATVALLLLATGCNQSPPAPPPTPAPEPSSFYVWCKENKFGIDSPQSAYISAGLKNVPGMPIGDFQFEAWTKCQTADEANEYLAGVEANIRQAAQELGVELVAAPKESNDQLTLRYQTNRIDGTLIARMELRDSEEGGELVKRYFVLLTLTERASKP